MTDALPFPQSRSTERQGFLAEFNAVVNPSLLMPGVRNDHRDTGLMIFTFFSFNNDVPANEHLYSVVVFLLRPHFFKPRGNLSFRPVPTSPWSPRAPHHWCLHSVHSLRPALGSREFNKVVFSSLWQRDLKSDLVKLKRGTSLVLRHPLC